MDIVLYILLFSVIPVGIILNQALIGFVLEIIISIILIVYLDKKNKSINLIKVYFALLILQNLLIGIGGAISNKIGHESVANIKLFTQVPTVFIVLTALYLVIKRKYSYKAMDFFGFLMCAIIGVSFIISSADALSKVAYARNFILYYIIYVVGRTLIKKKEEVNELIKFFIYALVAVITFGIISEFFFTKEVWHNVFGVRYVYEAKGLPLDGPLPSMWRTLILGMDVPRMVSTYMEPVNSSYLMASGVVLSIFGDWTKNKIAKILIIIYICIGQILTFGKGGILLAGTVIGLFCIYFVVDKFIKLEKKKQFIISKVIMIIGIVIVAVLYYFLIGDSARPHFWGITNGTSKILQNPIGYGLGSGGNFANIFGSIDHANWLASGSESALISVGYQLGVLGLIVFILLFELISYKLFNVYVKTKDNLAFALSLTAFGLLIVSVFQENTLSPQCVSYLMIFAGAMSNMETRENKIALVGSSGGHLTQVYLLKDMWKEYDRFWVTFDKEDSQSLLKDERKYWCYYPTNRNIKNLIKNTFLAIKLLYKERPTIMISTGAAVAIPFFYIGKLFGTKLIYIEVYDRIELPTVTGKVVYPITDEFILQWEEQKKFYPKGKVIGGII